MTPTADESFTFRHQPAFDAGWEAAGLDDADLARLQLALMTDPACGDVMGGTGGLRKVRYVRPGGGKSGGVRALYAVFLAHRIILLVAVFRKGQKANLNAAEKRQVAAYLSRYARTLPPVEPEPEE